ncbi:hypothetical protein PsorP6_012571 [Peronosclerospora sorghi]|uniref:Uncharacterized protein n=1 Tax=Peronosclerospora sorghi TaxID=230839 RepID=A0ACC0WGK6_9STRA|nr:hypothetical protein PsorP6_012571 [Peronosclerospora sorghi]
MAHSSATISMVFLLLVSHLSVVVCIKDTASDTVESLFDSTKGIKLSGSLLAIGALAVGAVMLTMGYRVFRAALFAIGFIAGGVGVALVVERILDPSSSVILASWIAFVVGGLVCGSLVLCLYSLGIFVAGAAAGVALAIIMNNSFGYKIYPSHPDIVLIVLCIVLGILGGILASRLEKPALITATSLIGAAIFVWGVGYFAGDFPTSTDLKRYARREGLDKWVYSIPDAWWGYLVAILLLFLLGLFIQFRKTGRGGVYHRSQAIGTNHEETQYVPAMTPRTQAHVGNPVTHV